MKIYPYVRKERANADGSYPVYFIIKRNAGRFFVNTGIVTSDRLVGMTFPKSDPNWKRKTTLLGKLLSSVEALCLSADIASLSDNDLKDRIHRDIFGIEKKVKKATLYDLIVDFAKTKKEQTCYIYKVTAKKVLLFDSRAGLDIDSDWLEAFRQHYLNDGMGINGVGKELRNIRAVFNWAIKKGLTDNYPFSEYKIVSEETVPNNISVNQLRKLFSYECQDWQKPYKDFFFLSFFLAGINPIDLLNLKKSDVKDGHVTFIRRKTDKQGCSVIRRITLPIIPQAQEIIDRYPSQEGFLLGFMDCRNNYRSFTRQANDALQKIGPWKKVLDKVGKLRKIEIESICPDITLYSARYSFGSIAANDLDLSERTIGMCLGHSWSKNVTARYMAHDQSKVDNAVRKVVDWFFAGSTELP